MYSIAGGGGEKKGGNSFQERERDGGGLRNMQKVCVCGEMSDGDDGNGGGDGSICHHVCVCHCARLTFREDSCMAFTEIGIKARFSRGKL